MLKQLHWLKESRSKQGTCRLSRSSHMLHASHVNVLQKEGETKDGRVTEESQNPGPG